MDATSSARFIRGKKNAILLTIKTLFLPVDLVRWQIGRCPTSYFLANE